MKSSFSLFSNRVTDFCFSCRLYFKPPLLLTVKAEVYQHWPQFLLLGTFGLGSDGNKQLKKNLTSLIWKGLNDILEHPLNCTVICRMGIAVYILGLASEMPELDTQITTSLVQSGELFLQGIRSLSISPGRVTLGSGQASCYTAVDLKLAAGMTSPWVLLVLFSLLRRSALNYFSLSKCRAEFWLTLHTLEVHAC